MAMDASSLRDGIQKGGLSSASAVGEVISLIALEAQAYNSLGLPLNIQLDPSRLLDKGDTLEHQAADLDALLEVLKARSQEVQKLLEQLSRELAGSGDYQLYEPSQADDPLSAEAERVHQELMRLEGIDTKVFQAPSDTALGKVIEKLTAGLADLQAQLATERFIQDTLTDQRNIARTNFITLLTKSQESQVASAIGGVTEAKVIYPALPPSSSSSPNIRSNVTTATAGGFLLSLLGALIFEYCRRALETTAPVAVGRDISPGSSSTVV